jgi:preprotein translocase subunit SecE
MQQLITFLRTSWLELKKVTWPGRKEIIASTVIVIIVSIFIMTYIGLIDFVLTRLVRFVFK